MEQLIMDLNDIAAGKEPNIPYQLHEGLGRLLVGFGITFPKAAKEASEFFIKYARERNLTENGG
jgi:hypothetical protein